MGRSRLRGRPRFAWLGLLALCAVVLAACDATAAPTPPPPLHLGGSVSIALAATPSPLLPGAATDAATAEVDAAIWAPLFYEDATGAIQPELASAVPTVTNGGVSTDGKTITIHLRPSLRWSDGQPLTATDVAFTFAMLSSVDYVGQAAPVNGEILNVIAVDSTTVRVTLQHADASFIARRLTNADVFAPLPQHLFGSETPTPGELTSLAEGALPLVTSGPFTVASRSADEIDLVKNPRYDMAPKPLLDKVIFKIYADSSAVVAALQSGAVDTASNLPALSYDTLSALSNYKLTPSTNLSSVAALSFNFANPILADPVLREALAISVDPTAITSTLWHGLATPTCDDAISTPAHQPSLINAKGQCAYGADGKTYDPTAAGALLDADGWILGANGLRAKAGAPLTLRITVAADDAEQRAIALFVADSWKPLGVQVVEVDATPADLQSALIQPTSPTGAPAFDVIVQRLSLGADPSDSALFSSESTPSQGGENITGYANASVDTLEQQQLATLDPTARLKLINQIHAQVLKDIPLVYLYAAPTLSMAKTTLNSYAPSGLGPSETWNIGDWWLTGEDESPTAIPS